VPIVWLGTRSPLDRTFDANGVNFAFLSQHASLETH